MKRSSRWTRLPWILGLALLTASLVGAGHVLHSRPTDPPARTDKSYADRNSNGHTPGVVCHGTVDVDGGYMNHPLTPLQAGKVAEVLAYEGQVVRKDDILLRIEDEQVAEKVAEAEVGVRIAEAQLRQARQALDRYQHLVAAQQAAVDAGLAKVRAAELRLKRGKFLLEKQMTNAEEIAALEEEINAGKAVVKAEEEKLREVRASKPDANIDVATENGEMSKQRLKQAQTALKNCRLLAPADGTILRLNVAVGAVLGPQSRQAPVLFVPAGPRIIRAEVEQEFAHRVHLGQAAVVEDEANAAITWQGKVKRLADAFLPRRSVGDGLTLTNGPETRYLECLIELNPSATPPRLGQRVRVNLGTRN